MSKKKSKKTRKSVATPKQKKSKTVAKKVPAKSPSWLQAKLPPSSEQDGQYRQWFIYLTVFITVVTLLLSAGSGMNGDDEYQNDYSTKLVNYYLSGGADTSALYIEKGNMHLYGGFFDLTTGLVNHTLGLNDYQESYHVVRHIFNGIFGVLAMLFVGLIVREIAGWRAGILALLLMFLSPRFLGHSFMNPKDIPFAAGFAISIYYMILLFRHMPKPKWQHALGLSLGIALALATRAGGLLIVAYLGLFAGLDYLFKNGIKNIGSDLKTVGTYAAYAIGVSTVGYLLAVLTWPAALVDPINHPIEALSEFSKLGIKIRLLFMGDNVMSDETAWFYPLLWIFQTIPLFTLVGLIGSIIMVKPILEKYDVTAVLLLYFATTFPVAYIIYKDSILHDGWRHLMFVYPSMVALASLFWIRLEDLVKGNKMMTYAVWAVLGLMVLESTVFIARNIKYPYVYFNPLAGGVGGAFGNYETDYWGVSVKQAVDWLEAEGILSENMQDSIVLGTTFFYNTSRYTSKAYPGKVKTKYVRFNKRYSEDWDYGIFPSRFIRGPHLRANTWPNSKTIHTIKANGVPILAIEKNEQNYAYLGEVATKQKNWAAAADNFRKEVEQVPDNEVAWNGLANAYLNLGKFNETISAANEVLTIAPKNETALYYLSLAYLNLNDPNNARSNLQALIKVSPDNAIAYYYLAIIEQGAQNPSGALKHLQKAIEINQRFKAAYEMAANIYDQQGDTENARRFREVAAKL